jgi:hypothetical protein
MGYADLDAAKLDLGVALTEPEQARLAQLDAALSAEFDRRTGRRFGGEAVAPSSRTVQGRYSDLLILPVPIVSIASVSFADWTMEPSYRPALIGEDGAARGIELLTGGSYWAGPVEVSGVWADDAGEPVPADVRAAVTYLVVAFWQRRKESPEGFVGPEGLQAPRRFDPWKDSRVTGAVAAHKLRRVAV